MNLNEIYQTPNNAMPSSPSNKTGSSLPKAAAVNVKRKKAIRAKDGQVQLKGVAATLPPAATLPSSTEVWAKRRKMLQEQKAEPKKGKAEKASLKPEKEASDK